MSSTSNPQPGFSHPDLAKAPAWAVEELKEGAAPKAAAKQTTAARRPSLEIISRSSGDSEPEPPVRLSAEALARYRGDQVTTTPDGTLDRSTSLWSIGGDLYAAGASESLIAATLSERDRTLGWDKYSDRSDGGRTEYERIARKLVEGDVHVEIVTIDGSATVPEFPVTLLPKSIRDYVEEGKRSLGCAADFIAIPILAFVGAVLGRLYAIELKPGYRQHATLFAAVVGEPGTAKSPALTIAQRPLVELQRRAKVRYDAEIVAYNAAIAKMKEGDEKPEKPVLEHFITTDATTEAIAQILADSVGLVVIRDEFSGWVKSFDAYRGGRGGDRQNWLGNWSNNFLKVDRKTAEPIIVERPVVSVIGGIQPEVLPTLAEEAGRADGFLERILFGFPDPEPMQWSEERIQEETYTALVTVLDGLRHSQGGIICLSAAARALWIPWYNSTQRQAQATGGILGGVFAKMPNQAARLALILHTLANPQEPQHEPVSEATMDAAIQLAAYFVAHAKRVLPLITSPAAALAERVLACLTEAKGAWLSKGKIYKALGGHETADRLNPALKELEDRGDAQHRLRPAKGAGHPAEEWRSAVGAKRSEPPILEFVDGPVQAEPASPHAEFANDEEWARAYLR